MKHPKEKPENPRARRKLLRGIVAGTGVAAVAKTIPGNWSKPVVETAILPVHAQTTEQPGGGNVSLNLACEVADFTAEEVDGISPGGTFNPAGGPVGGGASVTFDSINSVDKLFTLFGLSATLSPLPVPAGETVSLTVMSSGDMSGVSASPPAATPNGAGVATFPNVSGFFLSDSSTGSTGTVSLVFSAPSATSDCTISFTFVEDQLNP